MRIYQELETRACSGTGSGRPKLYAYRKKKIELVLGPETSEK
jgi:hypothetical protein